METPDQDKFNDFFEGVMNLKNQLTNLYFTEVGHYDFVEVSNAIVEGFFTRHKILIQEILKLAEEIGIDFTYFNMGDLNYIINLFTGYTSLKDLDPDVVRRNNPILFNILLIIRNLSCNSIVLKALSGYIEPE